MCVNILVQTLTSALVPTHSLFYAMGPGELVPLPGLKRLEHKVDDRPPASAEVKNEWRRILIRYMF